MTIYSFWVYDRHCRCILQREWNKGQQKPYNNDSSATILGTPQSISSSISKKSEPSPDKTSLEDIGKLIFGVVFSLRNIAKKLDPNNINSTPSFSNNNLINFATSKYRLHFFETPTNIRFVMVTDLAVDDLQYVLRQIYTNLYVECLSRNSLSPVDFLPGETITSENFIGGLESYITSLPAFN